MSPEQTRGVVVDRRTDIWAFGCILYELLTAQPALPGATVHEVISAIRKREPDYDALPVETPARIRRLIERCLTKDPAARLRDIAIVRAEIARARSEHGHTLTRRWVILAAAVAAAGALGKGWITSQPEIRSIAVLPLINLSGNPDVEHFVDGMTESLITDLAEIGTLEVISRSSVMIYKGTYKPFRQVAKELNADVILSGSAARAGDRIRISTQLIDCKTERHLWAGSFERGLAEVRLLQTEVGRTVAQCVRALTARQHAPVRRD